MQKIFHQPIHQQNTSTAFYSLMFSAIIRAEVTITNDLHFHCRPGPNLVNICSVWDQVSKKLSCPISTFFTIFWQSTLFVTTLLTIQQNDFLRENMEDHNSAATPFITIFFWQSMMMYIFVLTLPSLGSKVGFGRS